MKFKVDNLRKIQTFKQIFVKIEKYHSFNYRKF